MIQKPLTAESLKKRFGGPARWMLHGRTDWFCSLKIFSFSMRWTTQSPGNRPASKSSQSSDARNHNSRSDVFLLRDRLMHRVYAMSSRQGWWIIWCQRQDYYTAIDVLGSGKYGKLAQTIKPLRSQACSTGAQAELQAKAKRANHLTTRSIPDSEVMNQ